MSRLFLVRHGRAAAGWGDDLDPGLDDVGRAQAAAAASALAPLGPLPVVSSPLRRTRETAAPFEAHWGVTAAIDDRVAEVRSPTDDLAERSAWLAAAMKGAWSDLPDAQQAWRDEVVDALRSLDADTVVVTHFVAINVAVGAATGDDRVVCFSPAHCSRTVLEADASGLRVVELGEQATTVVR